eukprot:15270104-Alexandrium_andersonii.AAC.1
MPEVLGDCALRLGHIDKAAPQRAIGVADAKTRGPPVGLLSRRPKPKTQSPQAASHLPRCPRNSEEL